MKFTYAAVLASLGSAFAKVLLLAHLKESTEYVYVALPNDNKDDRLYISNKSSWDSGYCLVPKSDQQTKLITLASDYDSEKFVNVDSNGFLVLADKGYAFDRIDNGNIFINNADTFTLSRQMINLKRTLCTISKFWVLFQMVVLQSTLMFPQSPLLLKRMLLPLLLLLLLMCK